MKISVRNRVKLEIRLFVMNFNSRGFSLRVLYCVVDTGYVLGKSLGIADLHCQKVEITKWLKHNKDVNSLNKLMGDLGFFFL